jgi:hypothetical protein
VPGQGVVVEGVKEVKYSNKPSKPPGMYKNGWLTALNDLKNAKNAVFKTYKYLTKYTPETFFEEYIYFKIFCCLRHCGVIPVQSFGSHIRPQPPGLWLNKF